MLLEKGPNHEPQESSLHEQLTEARKSSQSKPQAWTWSRMRKYGKNCQNCRPGPASASTVWGWRKELQRRWPSHSSSSLSAGPWGLSRLSSELRSGTSGPPGPLRARKTLQAGRATTWFSASEPYSIYVCPLLTTAWEHQIKKKKIKGKTLINNNQDHLQF